MAQLVKTVIGLARASVKTINGLAIASVKTVMGLDNTAAGYAFTETFEGSQTDSQSETGYDNTSWTSSTNANEPRYTTSPAPFAGTYSWRSASTAALYRTITATGEFHCYFIAAHTTLTANEVFFELRDAVNVTVGAARVRATDTFRIEHVGVNSANGSNGIMAANAVVHIWIDWAKGTGTNGTMAIYHASSATKPGSATLSITTGTAVTDATVVRFNGGAVTIYDNFVYDTTQTIGSNPV